MKEGSPTVEVAVIFTGVETENAYQIVDPASDEVLWIPFSQTEERHGALKGGEGTIIISEWIAEKTGLL